MMEILKWLWTKESNLKALLVWSIVWSLWVFLPQIMSDAELLLTRECLLLLCKDNCPHQTREADPCLDLALLLPSVPCAVRGRSRLLFCLLFLLDPCSVALMANQESKGLKEKTQALYIFFLKRWCINLNQNFIYIKILFAYHRIDTEDLDI